MYVWDRAATDSLTFHPMSPCWFDDVMMPSSHAVDYKYCGFSTKLRLLWLWWWWLLLLILLWKDQILILPIAAALDGFVAE